MTGDGSMMDDSQVMVEDGGKQNERSASGWRARLKQKSTGHAVRVPSLHRSDSQQSNMGEKIKLDPTVTEYLRQMSAGRDGL